MGVNVLYVIDLKCSWIIAGANGAQKYFSQKEMLYSFGWCLEMPVWLKIVNNFLRISKVEACF